MDHEYEDVKDIKPKKAGESQYQNVPRNDDLKDSDFGFHDVQKPKAAAPIRKPKLTKDLSKEEMEKVSGYLERELQQLNQHFEQLMAEGGLGLKQEYEELNTLVPPQPAKASQLQNNVRLNRYRNIVAFDHSRVVVTPNEYNFHSDYVNASFIKDERGKNMYIASQGPVPDSFVGFWQMVWENTIEVIVMVTAEVEGGKLKCHRYWPNQEEKQVDFGFLTLTYTGEEDKSLFFYRSFTLSNKLTGESRAIHHLMYTAWPDHGVPSTSSELLSFRKAIRALQRVDSPLLIHCSAGVGRTGTYIGIDRMLEAATSLTPNLSIKKIVLSMRQSRNYMVQSLIQYRFVYQASIDALTRKLHKLNKDLLEMFPTPEPEPQVEQTIIEEEIRQLDDELKEVQESMSAETGLTPTQVADIRKIFDVDKPVAPPVTEIPIPIKEPEPVVMRKKEPDARHAEGKPTDDLASAKRLSRAERLESLLTEVTDEKTWKSRGNVPLALEDKGYKKPDALGITDRLVSLKEQAQKYEKAAKSWTQEEALYDPTVDLTPLESRLQSLAQQREMWKLRDEKTKEQLDEEQKKKLATLTARMKSLAQTLASNEWKDKGDGMRGKKIVQPGARIDTVEKLGGLHERLELLRNQTTVWTQREAPVGRVVATPKQTVTPVGTPSSSPTKAAGSTNTSPTKPVGGKGAPAAAAAAAAAAAPAPAPAPVEPPKPKAPEVVKGTVYELKEDEENLATLNNLMSQLRKSTPSKSTNHPMVAAAAAAATPDSKGRRLSHPMVKP